jgi:hypothetical protein
MKYRHTLRSVICAVVVLMTSSPVFAHGGGLDANGCHGGAKVYHCHKSKAVHPRPKRGPVDPPRPPVVELSEQRLEPTCASARFIDPTDAAYSYCARANQDFEVYRDSKMTGLASPPSAEWYAIDKVKPAHPHLDVAAATVDTQTPGRNRERGCGVSAGLAGFGILALIGLWAHARGRDD